MAFADDYRPSEFFSLDLSRAVLSPKPLGPPAQFEPVPVEAKTDHGPDQHAAAEPKIEEPKVERQKPVRTTRVTEPRETAPHERKRAVAHVPARSKLARRHSNPLNAEARDTRIQTWPCRTGGICNWQR
ncbi:hypothetical protein QMZ05_35050 [Bradyrhizobium sp. INPA03-11B]|uniref:hypothetical protein n=1 Tax=Bradyrhizobium sp. INPA03-11B TaxID=418598 RepID=UPI00338D4F31